MRQLWLYACLQAAASALGDPPRFPQSSPRQLAVPSAVADPPVHDEIPTSQFLQSLSRNLEDAQMDTLFSIELFDDISADKQEVIEVECTAQDAIDSTQVSDLELMDIDEKARNGTTPLHTFDVSASPVAGLPSSPPSILNSTSSDSPSLSNSSSPVQERPARDGLTEGWLRHLRRTASAGSTKPSRLSSWTGIAALVSLLSQVSTRNDHDCDEEMECHPGEAPGLTHPDDDHERGSDSKAMSIKERHEGPQICRSGSSTQDELLAAQQKRAFENTQANLSDKQLQALIALHRTLLNEHRDFFHATTHTSNGTALKDLSKKYNIPARIRHRGIRTFMEALQAKIPYFRDQDLGFANLSSEMLAVALETVFDSQENWIDCLGDLSRYQMAIEDDDFGDAKAWIDVTRHWYSPASEQLPTDSKVDDHLSVPAYPDELQTVQTLLESELFDVEGNPRLSRVMGLANLMVESEALNASRKKENLDIVEREYDSQSEYENVGGLCSPGMLFDTTDKSHTAYDGPSIISTNGYPSPESLVEDNTPSECSPRKRGTDEGYSNSGKTFKRRKPGRPPSPVGASAFIPVPRTSAMSSAELQHRDSSPMTTDGRRESLASLRKVQAFYCTQCPRSYRRRCELNKHMISHTKPVKCNTPGCGKTFSTSRDLKRHVIVNHERQDGERRRVQCDFPDCNRMFARKDHLVRHKRNAHGNSRPGRQD